MDIFWHMSSALHKCFSRCHSKNALCCFLCDSILFYYVNLKCPKIRVLSNEHEQYSAWHAISTLWPSCLKRHVLVHWYGWSNFLMWEYTICISIFLFLFWSVKKYCLGRLMLYIINVHLGKLDNDPSNRKSCKSSLCCNQFRNCFLKSCLHNSVMPVLC